jgi:hypothetical protein
MNQCAGPSCNKRCASVRCPRGPDMSSESARETWASAGPSAASSPHGAESDPTWRPEPHEPARPPQSRAADSIAWARRASGPTAHSRTAIIAADERVTLSVGPALSAAREREAVPVEGPAAAARASILRMIPTQTRCGDGLEFMDFWTARRLGDDNVGGGPAARVVPGPGWPARLTSLRLRGEVRV